MTTPFLFVLIKKKDNMLYVLIYLIIGMVVAMVISNNFHDDIVSIATEEIEKNPDKYTNPNLSRMMNIFYFAVILLWFFLLVKIGFTLLTN